MSLYPAMIGGAVPATPPLSAMHTHSTNPNTGMTMYGEREAWNAYTGNAPSSARFEHGATLSNQVNTVDPNSIYQLGYIHAAPFSKETYEADPYMDDRIYTGIYTDPETGQQYHTYEEGMPDREVDYSLNPSHESMERLFENYTGGLGGDAKDRLGLPHYKPEDNLKEAPLSTEDYYRREYGDVPEQRARDEEFARNQLALTAENTFAGIRDDMGHKYNHVGLQPIHHGLARDAGLVHRPGDIDHRERAHNPTPHNGARAPSARPQLRNTTEMETTWISRPTFGYANESREVNQMPGDREAQAMYGNGQHFPLHPKQDIRIQLV